MDQAVSLSVLHSPSIPEAAMMQTHVTSNVASEARPDMLLWDCMPSQAIIVCLLFRKGKKICFAFLQKDPKSLDVSVELGSHWKVDDAVMDVLEECLCKIYGRDLRRVGTHHGSRYPGRTIRKMDASVTRLLPPCKESLVLHTRRANYVCHIWRLPFIALIGAPNPSLYGLTDDPSVQWTPYPFLYDMSNLCCEDKDSDVELDPSECQDDTMELSDGDDEDF